MCHSGAEPAPCVDNDQLIKHGYPTSYAAALQATSAELGVIIPPSTPRRSRRTGSSGDLPRVACLMVVAYVPWISLALRDLVYAK